MRQGRRFVAEGGVLLVTPDGPRGPANMMPLGPVHLARLAGCPVYLLGLAAKPSLAFETWDAMRAPLPFARACLAVAGPLWAPANLAQAEANALRQDWQSKMMLAQERAEAALTGSLTPRRPLPLAVYRGVTSAASFSAPALLKFRATRGKEDPLRQQERLGQPSLARPDGRLAWLHGASVGESLSLLPLANLIRASCPAVTVLMTSSTLSSAKVLADRLPDGTIHQYVPIDTPKAVGGFLGHWRPEIGVFVESELWPNLILTARAWGVKMALASARLSRTSFDRWRWAPRSAQTLFAGFDLILARDTAALRRLARLGVRSCGVVDLKFGASPLAFDARQLARLRRAVGDRSVILAASTHAGEEELIAASHFSAGPATSERTLLVVAPRHPGRADKIEAGLQRMGLTSGRESVGELPGDSDVLLADGLGQLGMWYRLATLTILGGSFVRGVGGHNPLEAARLGCPIVFGPNVEAWPVYAELQGRDAARAVQGEADLASIIAQVAADPTAFAAQASRAAAWVESRDAETRVALGQILALLDR